MTDESAAEDFSTPLGDETASPVRDARFTSASLSSDSSMEARTLFGPITTGTVVRKNEEERNIVLDYSSITNAALPAEEVLCLTEVRREEAEVGDTDSVGSHEDMKILEMGFEEAIQDQLIQLVQDDIEGLVSDDLHNWILKKGIGELSIPKPPDTWDPVDADQKAQVRGAPS